MGRDFIRKTPKVSAAALEQAIKAVQNGEKVRTAARIFDVPRGTLQRRVKMPVLKQHSKQVLCRLSVIFVVSIWYFNLGSIHLRFSPSSKKVH